MSIDFISNSNYKEKGEKNNNDEEITFINDQNLQFLIEDQDDENIIKDKDTLSSKSKESVIIFEYSTYEESTIEMMKFSLVQFYNFCVFTLGYTFNFYFLSKKYTQERLNSKMVTAIGMCNLYFNAFVIAIIRGLTAGYDILAVTKLGMKDYDGFYRLFFVSLISVFTLNTLLALFTHLYSKLIITFFFNVSQQVNLLIDEYMFYLMLVIPIMSYSFMLTKIVTITKRNKAYSIILTINLLIEILSSYTFIVFFDFSISGASLALLFSRTSLVLIGGYYFFFISPFRKKNISFKFNSFKDLLKESISYIKFTFPNVVSHCLTSWQMELAAILSYYISVDSYIAFVLFSTISNFYNNFSSSFGSGMVSFCGNNMGRKNETQFKKHVKIAFTLLWFFYLMISLGIIILSSSVYSLLVSDVDIIDLMTNTSISYLIWQFLSITFSMSGSYFRIIHKQNTYMVLSFFNYYVFQLIVGLISIFYIRVDLNGFFLALSIGHVISIGIIWYQIRNINYSKLFLDILKE